MIYLQVSATESQAAHEVAAYQSVGWDYVYNDGTTPTQANYGSIVQAMQSAGAQYVTEYSDDNSAERLLEAMQQANFAPQVVDWFSEEYTPSFAQRRRPSPTATSSSCRPPRATTTPAPTRACSSWRAGSTASPAGNWHQDIFAILAWSAGLAFEQAAKAVGPT